MTRDSGSSRDRTPGRARPPWWPHNEPWPPSGPHFRRWHSPRGRFVWRLRLLFGALFFLFIMGSAAAFWFGGGFRSVSAAPLVLLVVLFVFVLATGRALRRVARPVEDLMEAADHVADGDYTTRVPEAGPPEMRTLARTFNQMIVRLQSTDERRRKLLADITHDLRTPLTVIQGNLEGLLDGIYPRDDAHLMPILEETRLLARLVDDLRTLTLVEAGELPLHKERLDLGLLVEDTAASFQAEADAAGIGISTQAIEPLPAVFADPVRIRQVLGNIITNALRYTPRGGTVRIECAARDGRIVVSVHDTGQGIAADELPQIFDRFYRSPDSKGSGLGLTIAKNLVAAHDGEITAESVPGTGTTIRFTLPATPQS